MGGRTNLTTMVQDCEKGTIKKEEIKRKVKAFDFDFDFDFGFGFDYFV